MELNRFNTLYIQTFCRPVTNKIANGVRDNLVHRFSIQTNKCTTHKHTHTHNIYIYIHIYIYIKNILYNVNTPTFFNASASSSGSLLFCSSHKFIKVVKLNKSVD